MPKEFLGYHSEWNLGSPGGWVYQKMAQEIGKLAWERISRKSGISIELDFDHPILDPMPNFARLLLRAHQNNFGREQAFIALVAEKETLEKVGENIRMVDYLNSSSAQQIAAEAGIPEIKAVLIDPTKLALRDEKVYVGRDRVTVIFLDFNNNVIVKLRKKYNLDALLSAIKQGIVTNPRGMEPMGAKGVFEAATSEYRRMLSETTLQRTPWTRQFYPRPTTGPQGETIADLVQWAQDNWPDIILKPVHGYSGQGIIIGRKHPERKRAVQQALDSGDYIIQQFIPLQVWTEEFPWIDKENKRLFLKRWQTDFRCFITDVGLIGFVTRFGGIPTNVGSGGGVQSTAILDAPMPLEAAIKQINQTILDLGYQFIWELQQELDEKSIAIGSVYLLGPIMCTLRPRIITHAHIEQLKNYAQNLWRDALVLEKLWLAGKLTRYVQITEEEEAIARWAPWQGRPALIAADGLFGFAGSA